jgi:hypothetical protein
MVGPIQRGFWVKRLRVATLVCVLVLLAGLAAAALVPSASASPPQPCHSVQARGTSWGVEGSGVGCGFQRRWTRRYLNHARKPSGWSCHGRLFETGGCHKRQGVAFFTFYVQD